MLRRLLDLVFRRWHASSFIVGPQRRCGWVYVADLVPRFSSRDAMPKLSGGGRLFLELSLCMMPPASCSYLADQISFPGLTAPPDRHRIRHNHRSCPRRLGQVDRAANSCSAPSRAVSLEPHLGRACRLAGTGDVCVRPYSYGQSVAMQPERCDATAQDGGRNE